MGRELIKAVRLKALAQGASNSKNGIATQVSEMADISISEKTIANYLRDLEDGNDISMSKEIRESLSRYLGYENYKSFLNTVKKDKSNERPYIIVIIILFVVLILVLVLNSRKECMIWKVNQYEKIDCEEAKAKPIDLKLLKEFRKVEPECHWDFFFDENGSPKVWYFKKGKNDLELFTRPGTHPVNGKTLNEITEYMIREHLCASLE